MKLWLHTTAIALALTAGSGVALAQGSPVQCDRTFAVVDTDGDGIISAAEASGATSHEFQRMDADGSGTISVVEWQHCSGMAALPLTGRSTMDEGDSAETSAANDIPDQSTGAQTKGGSLQTANPDEWVEGDRPFSTDDQFQSADVNQDGVVSSEEAALAAQKAHEGQVTAVRTREDYARQYGRYFGAIDRDGDGTVSQQEWELRTDEPSTARFEVMDADGDGEVTAKEYQARRLVDENGDPVTVYYYYVQ